ncbi:MAG: DNA repair protein RecN [Elusimicrobia bacterium]|nr:DNA repair protein RecN [Elusimicrobiota bacterium]
MLLNLTIKNYALIEDLSLEFSEGLNIFTGETGAGKSVIIESLKLLLGERASQELIRKGANSCQIFAEFDYPSLSKEIKKYLKDCALDLSNEDTLFLRREIDISGKSRSFVNDIPVSLKTLSSIGDYLVDVHGQHEHQSLFSNLSQRSILDNFGDIEKLLAEIGENYSKWKELLSERQAQAMSEQEKQRLIDIYGFQVKEIDNASLASDEDEDLELKLPQLKNAEKLKNLSEESYQMLYEAEGSVIEKLSKIQKILGNINSLSGNLSSVEDNLNSASAQIEEAAKEIENFKEKLDIDPQSLEKLLERQDLIKNLKKKYGSSIKEILAFREKTAKELDVLLKMDQNRQEIEKEIEKTQKKLFASCAKLTEERKELAEKLSENVEKELSDLGMKKTRFKISIEKLPEPSPEGWDRVDFMFQANPGEDLKSLKNIASGGEISRVMLAVKTVLAKADKIPVLIFDEIDTGIGGPMGQTIGKKLNDLSSHHQIICITHLPQIAAFGRQNIQVTKEISQNSTRIMTRILSGPERIEEIARMLSGESVTASARKHAQELISNAQV